MKKENSGFTLVEIMVVVAVVGMLMAGLFKLISATGENTKKARTVARLQRIQNALAGFYAENGTYPPVQQFCSTNPYKVEHRNGVTRAASIPITPTAPQGRSRSPSSSRT